MNTGKRSILIRVGACITILLVGLSQSAYTVRTFPEKHKLPQTGEYSSPEPSETPGQTTNLNGDIDQFISSGFDYLLNGVRIAVDKFKPTLVRDTNQTIDSAAKDKIIPAGKVSPYKSYVDAVIREGKGVFTILGQDTDITERSLETQNAKLKADLKQDSQRIPGDVAKALGVSNINPNTITQAGRIILVQLGRFFEQVTGQIDQLFK